MVIGSKSLEDIWNDSYPEMATEKLWPDDPVPLLGLAKQYFATNNLIVDVPCGDGKHLFELSKIAPVIGCDTSLRGLRICESRKRLESSSDIYLSASSVFSMPFADKSIRNIFCCDLLGHLPDPDTALKEMKRVCSHDAVIVVSLFSTKDSVLNDSRMKAIDAGSFWFQDKWFFRFYDRTSAHELCHRTGFDIIHCDELRWNEGPHAGYREYEHEHVSWGLVLGVIS